MARIPAGAELIENPISKAPGFRIGNVIVLAGVPSVMQAMLDFAAKTMKAGAVMLVEVIDAGGIPEGRYGEALAAIAAAIRMFRSALIRRSRTDGSTTRSWCAERTKKPSPRRGGAVEEMVAALAGNRPAR